MATRDRDVSLDVMKGVGCLCMGISHASVDAPGMLFPVVYAVTFLARFSPMLFFSVSGVVNALQARRYPMRYFMLFSALFALYGLTYNAMWRGEVWQGIAAEFSNGRHMLAGDIPQYLAMVIVITVLVEKLWARPWIGYLMMAAIGAAMHFALNSRIPDFPFRQWFLATDPKVFPLFPWLVFPMLGNIAYRLTDTAVYRVTAWMALVCCVVFGVQAVQKQPVIYLWTDKFSMPIGYFLLSVWVQFGVFSVMRRWGKRLVHPTVLYVGRHSFPYLYIHILWIRLFETMHLRHPLLVWPLVIVLSVICVRLGERLNTRYAEAWFGHATGWWLLGAAVVTGVAVSNWTSLLLVVTGLVFSYNYRQLAVLLKARWTGMSTPGAIAA